VRRSGKSTLFYQVIDWLLDTKKIPPQQVLLINFEDLSLAQAGSKRLLKPTKPLSVRKSLSGFFLTRCIVSNDGKVGFESGRI